MRTTLTLDDDVAAMLKNLQQSRSVPFKQLVNDALRLGAEELLTAKPPKRTQYTFPVSMGPPLMDITDVSATLALIDEERDMRRYSTASAERDELNTKNK
jgi:hypothetical protein